MSSTRHLTATHLSETKVNKRHSSFNLRTTPTDGSPDLPHSLSPSSNPNCLHCINAETLRKQSTPTTQTLTPTTSTTGTSLNVRRKLSAISLPIPWSKRNRSASDDKTSASSIAKHSQQQKVSNPHKMSRDRLLTLDRLFSSGTHASVTTNDDEQCSPTTEFTALDESLRSNAKSMKPTKENGYLHNSYIRTR